MKPSELSAELRKIASKIEASRNPSRELVVKDLNHIIKIASGSRKAMSEEGYECEECSSIHQNENSRYCESCEQELRERGEDIKPPPRGKYE